MGFVALTMKATRLCNLRCSYCHDWRSGPDQTMPFPVLARALSAALRDPQHDAVDIYWHGGETTVLPLSFYEKALYLQARFRRPGQAVRNAIQTNGTRLTPAWARFLAANRFSVGVSLDGPRELHDRHRRYASGRPSFEDALRGIRLLQELHVPCTVLMVINESTLALGPEALFSTMLEVGAGDYALLPVKPANQPAAAPGTSTTPYTTPAQFGAFLARLYDRWREHGDGTLYIRELAALERRVAGGPADVCTLAGGCLGQYYVVEVNGEIAHCNLFVGDARYTLGNVLRDDFAAIRDSAALVALVEEQERDLAALRTCPEFSVCNGGCPHDRYLSLRHNPAHSAGCCGLRDLIGHVRDRAAVRA